MTNPMAPTPASKYPVLFDTLVRELVKRAKSMQVAIDGEWGSGREWQQIAKEEAGNPDVDAIIAVEAML